MADVTSCETVYWLIDYFAISHNTLCLPPQILQGLLSSNAFGKMQYSKEHMRTMVHANFGGQQSVLRGIRKIVENFYYIHKCI